MMTVATLAAVGGRTYEHVAISDEMRVVDREELEVQAVNFPNLQIHWTAEDRCVMVLKADVYDIGVAIGAVDADLECVASMEDVQIYDSMLDLLMEFVEDGAVFRTATFNDREVMLRKLTYNGIGPAKIEVL